MMPNPRTAAASLAAVVAWVLIGGCEPSRPSPSRPPPPSATWTISADQVTARLTVPAGTDVQVVRIRVVSIVNPKVRPLLVVVSVLDAGTPPRQVQNAVFSPDPPDAPAGFIVGLSAEAARTLHESGGVLVASVTTESSGVVLPADVSAVIEVRASSV
jgi:hypothetical protein